MYSPTSLLRGNCVQSLQLIIVIALLPSSSLSRSGDSEGSALTKCCQKGQILIRNQSAVEISSKYSCSLKKYYENEEFSNIWNAYNFPNDLEPLSPKSHPVLLLFSADSTISTTVSDRTPRCKNLEALENGDEIWFRILQNNEIVVGMHFWLWQIWLPVNKSSGYCLDHTLMENQHNSTINDTETLIFCELEGFKTYKLHHFLYGTSFCISAIFLFITLIISLLAKQGLGPNIHSWLLFSYFFSLFLFYVVEGARIWTKFDGLHIKPSASCFVHAMISHYLSLTSSFAIFFLGVHMQWTFWKMRPLSSARKRPKLMEVLVLIVCPWVLPLVGLVGGLIYNHFTNTNAWKEENGIFEFGYFRCASPAWFVGTAIYTIHFVLNVIYFLITGGIILNTIYHSKFAKKDSQNRRKFASDTFLLLVKISLLMGLFYGFTIYEIAFGKNASNPLGWGWGFGRVCFLGLQGLWIFIGFGWTTVNRKELGLQSWKSAINILRKMSFNPSSSTTSAGGTVGTE